MSDATEHIPLPPPELADRVLGGDRSDPNYDPVAALDLQGAEAKQAVLDLVGAGYSFTGRRFLDFGCGAGKLLRHFLTEAKTAEFYGCDIDAPSIAWLQSHLSPPLHVFVNDATPPLPLPDTHLDLIIAGSVLTHITDHWSGWLLELHRVLKDDGLIVASFMGKGLGKAISGQSWSENETGMTIFQYGEDFAEGRQGPMVLHSHWWIREHWGRLFEIESLKDDTPGEQGIVVLRKKDVTLTRAELEQMNPGEPRELAATLRQLDQLKSELMNAHCLRDAEARRRPELETDDRSLSEHNSPSAQTADSVGPPPAVALSPPVRRRPRQLAQRVAARAQLALGITALISTLQDLIARVDGIARTAAVSSAASGSEIDGAANSREVPPIWPSRQHVIPPRELWPDYDWNWYEYFRWPSEYRVYLTLLGNLRSDSSILEIGCHTGRTMLGLLDYLHPPGHYEGLDVSPKHVAFAQAAIGGDNPIFKFTALDVYHSWFNPSGRLDPSTVRLPYADASFDVIYAASVFTHQLPAATENYFRESARMLRPGGRCVFSFLVLEYYDEARAAGASLWLDVRHRMSEFAGVGVENPEYPDTLVAYEAGLISKLADAAGLRVERLLPGTWSGTQSHAINDQELVVLVKD